MDKLPVGDIAFSGYRLLAQRPTTALAWGVFFVITTLAASFVGVAMSWKFFAIIHDAGYLTSTAGDDIRWLGWAARILGVAIVLSVGGVIIAAASRAVLRPEEARFGYLRFGKEELRVMVTLAVIWTLAFVLLEAVSLAVDHARQAASPGATLAMSGGHRPPEALLLMALFASPAVLLLGVLVITLSLAPAQTVGERSIRLLRSFRLARGQFWRLAAIYLRAGLPVLGAWLVLRLVGEGLSAVAPEPFVFEPDTPGQPPPPLGQMLAGLVSPVMLLSAVLDAGLRVLAVAAFCVPAATAYTRLASRPEAMFDEAQEE